MTRTVKVQEAKTHLSALLAAVERGEDIVIDWEHRDPFDRMLAAQSLVESAPVVTLDVRLHQREGLRTIW